MSPATLAVPGQLDLLALLDEHQVHEQPLQQQDVGPTPPPERSPHGGQTGPGAAWLRTVARWADGAPVTWTAPYDCGADTKGGEVLDGFRCLHCGQIEVGEYQLESNHGIAFRRPETWQSSHPDYPQQCSRQRMTSMQAFYAARDRGLLAYQCRHCRIWTCEQLVNTTAHDFPYNCRGERTGHDWRETTPEDPWAGAA